MGSEKKNRLVMLCVPGSSAVEHQQRLLRIAGSILGWDVCRSIPFLPKLHFPFPFLLSLCTSIPFLSLHFPFPLTFQSRSL